MPPRKPLPEAPVIFALRLPNEENIPKPADSSTNYSDILQSVEASRATERFSGEVMKEILSRTKSPTYSNNTACFWCCHPFTWKASVLPISYDAYENMYTCEGHYCSPECALAYLYTEPNLSDITRWTRQTLLNDLYRKLYKSRDLIPAPPRATLRLFGGALSIEQFREQTSFGDEMLSVQLPPLRLHLPTMNVQGPMRDVKKFVALSQETVEKASKELRLKRSKPVHSAVATLDKCMVSS
jgi:hypothetical protein